MAKSKSKTLPKKVTRRTPSGGTPAVKRPPSKPAEGPVLRSLRSVIYMVDDIAKAKSFYSAVLGKQPYFEQPYYVGYEIDGAELGLDPDTSQRKPGPGGAIAYWKVDDLYSSWEFSMMNGADPLEPPHNVGKGTDVAIVADPFGNYIGLIQVEN